MALTYIMNLSLKSATVLDDFKLARVLPIYKKGNRNYEGNYRPVSILPVASKVLEKMLYNQRHKYLEQNNLIYAFQSGFQCAHSTDTALTFLADKLRANMDEGLYTGMVTVDYTRASVFPFQNCVNSVSGFANSVFYRFRFDKFRFLPFHIFNILFHIFSSHIFCVNDFY